MNILVIRHAPAEESSPSGKDKDRPLSLSGRKFFEQVCKDLQPLLKGLDAKDVQSSSLSMDILLSSPLLRARETAHIFCQFFSPKTKKITDHLRPLAQPDELLLEINGLGLNSVVMVGHQPFLSAFVDFCVKETSGGDEGFWPDRGSVSLLEFPAQRARPKTATLRLLLSETKDS